MTRGAFWSGCFGLLAAFCGCRLERTMSFDTLEYHFAELSTAPHQLTVQADGRARYETHTNAGWPEVPEIGVYETTLTPEELAALDRALAAPPFQELPDHWGRVLSGDRTHRIRVTVGGQTAEKLVGTMEPVDPRTQNLIRRLDQVVARVMRSPAQTLRLTLSDAAVDAHGVFSATLSLASVGPQALACRNPVAPPVPTPAGLRPEAWPDKPPPQLSAHDVVFGAVTVVRPLSLPAGVSPDQLALSIPSGQTATFHVGARLEFRAAGTHIVRLRYVNDLREAAGVRLIFGEVYSSMVKVQVAPSAVGKAGQ